MRTKLLCLLVLGPLCSGAVQAEIYRYVDERGVRVYTDRPPPAAQAELVFPPRAPVRAVPLSYEMPRRAAPRRLEYEAANGGRLTYEAAIRAAAAATKVEAALIHAVISAESNYNPNARSASGAVGLMQLMPDTAKRYQVANRLDPVQNIEGGTRYLRDLMDLFKNDIRLVLAAYNAGEQTVIRAGNRIPPNPETSSYVPRVLEFYRRYRSRV
jgi:soluble lytic murein transglycosylase-like protein